MQTGLAHIQLNVQPENLLFYRDLMALLGWQTIYSDDESLGVSGKNKESFWFIGKALKTANDYDGPGVNHLGIGANSQADVDAVVTHLAERGVARLFATPRHRPEFTDSEDQTYYQVMFETPDRILLEVVYTGPKST